MYQLQQSPSKLDSRLHFFNNAPRGDPANTSFDDEVPDETNRDRSKPLGVCDTSFQEELKEIEVGFENYSIVSIMNEICPTQLPAPGESDKKIQEVKKGKNKAKENKQN